MTGKPGECYDVWGWIGKTRTKIGYAFKTERGTIRVKASAHVDKTKLFKAMAWGAEIQKRSSSPKINPSVAQQAEDFLVGFV